MSESEREKIQMLTKKHTLWDVFRGEDQLNKVIFKNPYHQTFVQKQKQKEERRKAREVEKAVPEQAAPKPKKTEEAEEEESENEKSKEKIEDEEQEEDLSEFMVITLKIHAFI